MNNIDPRLKKLAIVLKESLEKTKTKQTQPKDVRQILWPSHTVEEVLQNPFFYQQSITQPTILTQDQFFKFLERKNVPQEIIDKIALVNVDYRGFNNQIYQGQIVIHNDLKSSIKKIFQKILSETNFPMTSVFPISMFSWHSSSKLNNCGAFDWRFVENSDEISDHALGAGIDINPVLNPWVREGLANSPNHLYDPSKRGTLHANSDVVRIFKEEGWQWGGNWKRSKDWMHFYRQDIAHKYYGKIEVEE